MKEEKVSKYHTYLWYLIIFSLIGLLLEGIFCFAGEKFFNNERGIVLGPLCFIYGLAAILIIICLDRFKGHKLKLFIFGTILCATIEYVMNFLLEAAFGARLWNYSWSKFNLNSRICLEYACLWGVFTIFIIDVLKKIVDKLILKIHGKIKIVLDTIFTIILIIDIILSIWGIATYVIRAKETLNGKNYTSNNNIVEKFQNTVFSNEIMEKIFSKMEIVDNNGNRILIKNING